MKRRLLSFLFSALAFIVLFASKTPAQDFNFTSVNNNIEDLEKQGVFTGASLAADFDGEGVNNDTALIDQKRGMVFVLVYDQKTASPRFVIPIDVRDLTGEQLLPTSATAFVDSQTGLQNIAIAAARPNTGVGKLIVGVNDGNSLFNDINLFSVFDVSSSPTDVNHGDFNNDGADDLVYIDFRNNTAAVLLNDGNNRFLQKNLTETGNFEPVSAVVSDFNDDDYLDLAVLNKRTIFMEGFDTSNVRLLFGDGKGMLALSDDIYRVPIGAISLAGGLMDYSAQPLTADGKLARRMTDLNQDGYPDLAALSATAGIVGLPSVTILLNRFDAVGKFIVDPSIILTGFDDKGGALVVGADKGGAELVSGESVIGVGGAYHALGVGDFNADGSPDFVVSSSILPPPGVPGESPNYREAVYLVGNYTASTARIARPLSFGYVKSAPNTKDFSQLDPAESNDTFVAAIPGTFAIAENRVPGVLHISLNGSLWLDANRSSIFSTAPFIEIKRSDLNAPLGSGRKHIITAGESAVIPASATFLGSPLARLFLTRAPSGEAPPSFVTINQNSPAGVNPLVGEVIINSADVNRGPGDRLFRITAQAGSVSSPTRSFLTDNAFFTLVVKPNSPPAIAPIANQIILVGKTTSVQLNISDPENQRVTATVACDRGDFARIDPATNILSLTPTPQDVGTATCTVKASDQFNLSGHASFVVIAVSGAAIVSADFAKKSLVINGFGFGASGAVVTINGSDASSSIISQTDAQVVLKGNKKKLKLKKGTNRITISVNGAVSNTFVLKL